MGKGSDQFRLDPASGRVYFADNAKNLDHELEEKLYLRLRATDEVGHITESQVFNMVSINLIAQYVTYFSVIAFIMIHLF